MVENSIALQMLRTIISIFIFISPVIFCENERSGYIESPETEAYRWHFGGGFEILIWIVCIGTYRTVLFKNPKTAHFHSKCAFHVEGNSFTSNTEYTFILKSFKVDLSSALLVFYIGATESTLKYMNAIWKKW